MSSQTGMITGFSRKFCRKKILRWQTPCGRAAFSEVVGGGGGGGEGEEEVREGICFPFH